MKITLSVQEKELINKLLTKNEYGKILENLIDKIDV
nr:MAG TPA: hypothetical protein [Caudoviricetes sp.]